MPIHHIREKFDANALDIAGNLRTRGVSVAHVKAAHKNSVGVFDLVCGYRGRTHGMEIKVLGRHLEQSQVKFSRIWNGCFHVATNSDEAFTLILECHRRQSFPTVIP